MENLGQKSDLLIPIITEKEFEIKSFIVGYHEYKSNWKPEMKERLDTSVGLENKMDKFAVAALKNETVVGHLPKGRTGRFAKTVHYFLKVDDHNTYLVNITGKALNHGDGKGMKVPCLLMFVGRAEFIDILVKELPKKM